MSRDSFQRDFETLTGHRPFPWQCALYRRFIDDGDDQIPSSAELPTGLGKTSIIALWLLALMKYPRKMPRRLVYVVNRRTVVDQTTAEVMKYRRQVKRCPDNDPLRELVARLRVSTLRGQFADNHEWSDDPSKPAVICGTVDMIGSRLLFEGYRIGSRSRPLHAGFLGQDALLVHDEAHLEPAFQKLIETIQCEQKKEHQGNGGPPWQGLRVMSLSATVRGHGGSDILSLQNDDPKHPVVAQRLNATKRLFFHPCKDENKKLVGDLVELATDAEHRDSGGAILIFVRLVQDAVAVEAALKKALKAERASERIAMLTGTMRGLERDSLTRHPVFIRFLQESDRPNGVPPAEGTVYLVCTSAGEVGVNLSADHMVCDLSTWDSMAQRLGRVNRFGAHASTRVDVVHPAEFPTATKKQSDGKVELDRRREKTLELLRKLNGDASPASIAGLPREERLAAFSPEPSIPPATDILFDAWALTTIRDRIPGRPPVAPYLHGIAEWEPPRATLAWRTEVEAISDELIERAGQDYPQELLAEFPLKPHELVSDRADRVLEFLQKLAAAHPASPTWIIDTQQQVRVSTLRELANPTATKANDKRRLEQDIADSTILLPPSVGGLSAGMLDASSDRADDVADHWYNESGESRRGRVWDDAAPPTYEDGGKTKPMALIRTIDTNPLADESAPDDETSEFESDSKAQEESAAKQGRFWHWYVRPRDAEDATVASTRPISWQHHTDDVVERAEQIVNDLGLSDDLKQAVILAAELHDLGKQREIWQRSIGNPNPSDWHAKPGKPVDGPRWRPRPRLSDYRHEFGSLLDALYMEEHVERLAKLGDELRDLVLHLIAAHHGYARPHFPSQAYDHERYSTQQNEEAAHHVMRRYARLQRRYGRWGLAYLESLLRAADWSASARPSDKVAVVGGEA